MPTIAEIRQQYPDYSDLSDKELADKLHKKFYSDLDEKTFYQKINLSPEKPEIRKPTKTERIREIYSEKIQPIVKTGFEGIGLVGGSAIGTPAGIPGQIAGAGLGYAGGKQVTNLLDQFMGVAPRQTTGQQLLEAGKDVGTGAMLEMGGRALGGAISGIGRGISKMGEIAPPIRQKAIQTAAGKELLTQGTELTGEQIEKNIIIAKELEAKIPGLKFTRGQITGDAQAIALERSLIRSGIKVPRGKFEVSGADLNQEQRGFAEKALQDYYNTQLTSKGKISDLTDVLTTKKQGLEAGTKITEQKVNVEVSRLGRIVDEQELSSNILQRLNPAREASKKEASLLYDKIPNVRVGTENLQTTISNIKKEFDPLIESPKNFPNRITNGILQKITDEKGIAKEIGFQDLRKMRSTILVEKRMALGGANPNPQLARRLGQIQEAIEETVNTQLKDSTGTAGELYRSASSKYAEFAKKFKQGTIADVLQKGTRGEETRIATSNIASEFFTRDGIDDFIRTMGNDKLAMNSMRDYARFDMYNKTYNPYKETINTQKAFSWIQKNSAVLDKLGMKKEFVEIAKSGRGLEVAQKELDLFNKSMAARILNADPENIVKAAFGASKNYTASANELLGLAKGNKAAEEGIKKAVAEHIIDSSKVTAEGFFIDYRVSVAKLTNQVNKFAPALRVLYKNEPEKLKAIMDVNKAYQIAGRNVASPIGGGSDTMENISNVLAAVTGARAGQYYLLISVKKAFSRYSDNQVKKYLLRASFDPDYAINLMNMAKASSQGNTQKVIGRFDNLMSRLTVLGTKEAFEEQ